MSKIWVAQDNFSSCNEKKNTIGKWLLNRSWNKNQVLHHSILNKLEKHFFCHFVFTYQLFCLQNNSGHFKTVSAV